MAYGADATGVNYPAGGTGLRGWLSGIYGSLSVPKTLLVYTGAPAASGDNTLIAAPGAGVKIVVVGFSQVLTVAVATVGLLKDGAAGATKARWSGATIGAGIPLFFFPERRELRLTANTALVLNLSAANAVDTQVYYFLE